jgi:hypothetical protein
VFNTRLVSADRLLLENLKVPTLPYTRTQLENFQATKVVFNEVCHVVTNIQSLQLWKNIVLEASDFCVACIVFVYLLSRIFVAIGNLLPETNNILLQSLSNISMTSGIVNYCI